MQNVTFHGQAIQVLGDFPQVGQTAHNFNLVGSDLKEYTLMDYQGKRIVLNIFPSIDTGVCAQSVRRFNQEAASLDNTVVLCISADLPFAHQRFCAAEGIENVVTLSTFRSHEFHTAYGVDLRDGPIKGLCARAIIVIDENMNIIYAKRSEEISEEPDYNSALQTLKS